MPNAQQPAEAIPCLYSHDKNLACSANHDSRGSLLELNETGSVAMFASAKNIPWLRVLRVPTMSHSTKGNNKGNIEQLYQ